VGFLEQLYRDAVLDHARRPRNRGRLDPVTISHEGVNPSCGDELELHLFVEDGVVRAASFTGQGCAISQASASMMTDLVRGRRLDEARELIARFMAMVRGEGAHPSLGEAAVLEGVAKLHARVKCATLAWLALDEALERVPAAAGQSSAAASGLEPPPPAGSDDAA
jgi:nitrogen fixation protein NifU and related proteins